MRKIFIILIIAVLALLTGCSASNKESLSVTFFPSGKGDCVILEYGGEAMLIDAGYKQKADELLAYFSDRNITRLSAVIITHPHDDHIGGLISVIESGIDIGVIYKTDDINQSSSTYRELIATVDNNGIYTENPEIGTGFYFGGAGVNFIAPLDDYGELDNNSVVVKIDFAGKSILLCGDIMLKAENDLLKASIDLSAEILKVAHHGGADSSSKKFLQAVNPKYAVITCDEVGGYSPNGRVINRLKDLNAVVLRTDTDGIIKFVINNKGDISY